MSEVIARLAPSPTGVLHLGNARSFLLAWLSARAVGGQVLLRIEDLDGPRVKEGALESTLEDLEWMGLDWDGEMLVQTDRMDAYHSAIAGLIASGRAYPCICSRKEVEEAASAPHEGLHHEAAAYGGTCRGRFESVEHALEETGREAAVRFRVDTDSVPFVDGFLGQQQGAIAGDFVIQKRDGVAAYQLSCVVDDGATGVNEVLRADDLVPSTPRQLLLFEALDLTPPRYIHTPLLVGPDGRRLAKRHGDTSLRRFRSDGVTAAELVGYLAHRSGQRGAATPCTPTDLLDGFSLSSIPDGPVVVNESWATE
jgi:glutamyl-tRNA synthetase